MGRFSKICEFLIIRKSTDRKRGIGAKSAISAKQVDRILGLVLVNLTIGGAATNLTARKPLAASL
jgi:hypothetical protein